MRRACSLLLFGFAVAAMTGSALATAHAVARFSSTAQILKWMNEYRGKPDPMRAAAAIRDLSALGALRDPESAGVYLGFAAGVLAANAGHADALVARMLPLPAEDQWLIVRAIAYSGVPNWRATLAHIRARVPARDAMVERYLQGKLPVLAQYRLEAPKPDWFARMAQNLPFQKPRPKPVMLTPSADLLDMFWGFYYATGERAAVQRIVELLPWSTDKDDVDKLTLGGMAKYTLVSNASRDPALLATIRSMQASQPTAVRPALKEAIEAAEDVDVSRVRQEMLAALDKLRRNGSQTRRDVTFWGQVGEGALAVGCIAAAAAGQVEFGIPCVVGGAVSTGGLQLWSSQY